MRKLALLALFTLALAIPLQATVIDSSPSNGASADRSQSYITYDDGGTIVRQGDDGREIEGRVNLPLFPGDEVITGRRGRVEIRLSDGNVVALDRGTDVHFKSMLDSYDGDGTQTIIELKYGHMMVLRTDVGHEYVRLDTDAASYVANDAGVYAVETDRGRDRIEVFDGGVEVRTPQRTSRVRAGEEARVDEQGVYNSVSQGYATSDDFERWFLRRAERYGNGSSRYLDRSLAYADYDLGQNGSWVYVNTLSTWCWRPRVAVGWRPYYNGYWHAGLGGSLVWVSYEPWGWVPYHYGRWGYDPFYGWVWLPGAGYSPAWVYWMYGSGYVGWAPSGFWDVYRPYYNWCYRPYARASWDNNWGAFGRVRVGEIDLRPWTFVRPGGLIGTRVDTAALTADVVRERLLRNNGGDGLATISTSPARFGRNELRDPSAAIDNIVRRGLGSGAGNRGGNAPVADLTPFIRRDPELSPSVRDRVIRTRPAPGMGGSGATVGGGGLAPVGRGGLAPIGSGSVAPIGGGSVAPIAGSDRIGRGDNGSAGGVDRGNTGVAPGANDRGGVVRRGDDSQGNTRNGSTGTHRVRRGDAPPPTWRDNGGPRRGDASTPRDSGSVRHNTSTVPRDNITTPPDRVDRPSPRDAAPPVVERDWRSPAGRGSEAPAPRAQSGRGDGSARDIPRRIIDSIGGARVRGGDTGRASGSRDSAPRGEHSAPPPQRSSPPPSKSEGSHSSSSGGGSHESKGDHKH